MSMPDESAWRFLAFLPQDLQEQFIVRTPVEGPQHLVLREAGLQFKLVMAGERLERAVKRVAATLSLKPALPEAAGIGAR